MSLIIEGKSQVTNLIAVGNVLDENCDSTIATYKIKCRYYKNCKRRALKSDSIRLVKINCTKLMKNINTSIFQHQNIKSVSKAIYYEKKCILIYPRLLLNNKMEKMMMVLNYKGQPLFLNTTKNI